MPRPDVVFYVLASESAAERQVFACRLIEKLYRDGQFCYVLADDSAQAAEIDKALWTFRAGSFVPHQVFQGQVPAFRNTVLIGGDPVPEGWEGVIVNLSGALAPLSRATRHIIEILDAGAASKQAGRNRFRHYQESGIAITTHVHNGHGWVESRRPAQN
ncbi:DNA polymerase III subunit chi [Methylomonas sp. HYX-M1]|uniref:DNA polymerase III subunit chi n=1 Tax=Methylomonas sp. HYX-M1 TaxID=3139307 RepID=UPI00345C3197